MHKSGREQWDYGRGQRGIKGYGESSKNGSVTVEADSEEDAMYVFSDMDIDVDDEFQNVQCKSIQK